MSVLKKLQLWMFLFGCTMGGIFPLYASFFVNYKPGMQLGFTIGCIIAGVLVGVFAYAIVKIVLIKELKLQIIDRLSSGAQSVSTTSQEVFGLSHSLSESVQEQGSALHESSSSAHELNAMVEQNESSVSTAQQIALASKDAGERGRLAIQETVNAIEEMRTSISSIIAELEANNKEVANIVHVVSEIGQKTKVINDIVFQTKLLSFNASVEAARAGDAGKGFAVVAEEVGNLAQMSGNVAKEISLLLEKSSHEVESIVKGTQNKVDTFVFISKEKISNINTVAKQCEQVLEEVVSFATDVDQTVLSIGSASSEQARGIAEISKSIHELEKSNQHNSSVSHQAAEAAKKLSSQAEVLQDIVNNFVTIIEGENTTSKA